MRAITCEGAGGVEVLRVSELETPTAGPGEVLIKTAAVGVNRADVLQREGHYPPPKGTSELLGLEVSGTVAAFGDDVHGWQVGDECVALLAGGGYAEYVLAPAGQVVAPPPGMDLVTAAGVVEVAATVVSNLADVLAPARERDLVLLVHGGAGGIGTFAIPYAKAMGATVVATAGNPTNLAHCRERGADQVIDYHDDWVACLKDAHPRGADVILDIMGAKYLPLNVKALATNGHLCVIGLQGGRKGELDLSILLNKRATITATSLRFRPAAEKAAICRRLVDEVWPLFEDGTLDAGPQTRMPLDEAARAHEQLTSGQNTGKIVLVA